MCLVCERVYAQYSFLISNLSLLSTPFLLFFIWGEEEAKVGCSVMPGSEHIILCLSSVWTQRGEMTMCMQMQHFDI